eukprot:7956896-Lingulodinium_polyedra.AAC.1
MKLLYRHSEESTQACIHVPETWKKSGGGGGGAGGGGGSGGSGGNDVDDDGYGGDIELSFSSTESRPTHQCAA